MSRVVTDKEKAQKIASQRRIAAARTPEQRAAFNLYHRNWRKRRIAQMTPEQRAEHTRKETASRAKSSARLGEERAAIRRKYQAEWMASKRASDRLADRRKKAAWVKKKRETCPEFVLECRLRSRLKKAVDRYGMRESKPSTMRLVGCSRADLKKFIESKFKPGMTWENKRLWHIDHILPISSFDLMKEDEIRACFHYTNLQPLWARENIQKGNKIIPLSIKAA